MPFISVDLQKDFSAAGGACYQDRPCVDFIRKIFIPHCRKHGIQLAEIVSDYRQPRPGLPFAHCIPGTAGYESELPGNIKHPQVWIKCMHSPVWVREHGGSAAEAPGEPYSDPKGFTSWLASIIGPPDNSKPIVLIGLTLDCCVLCTAQELFFRGYRVEFLTEAVDTYCGSQEEKHSLFRVPLANWGKAVSWQEIKERTIG
ncbi:MAG: isochorismatase family protein [Proteobacteria bacterium]|nr:isochorismatase family protein [Pseudomonadota bacterium]MBU1454018.1 isochorismatase family protein [Pseudomonadota bacterium]